MSAQLDQQAPAALLDTRIDDLEARLASIEGRLGELVGQLGEVKEDMPKDALTIGVFSGDLDKILAAFIIALGATAYDMEVDMFFTFWATAALRDPRKNRKKDFMSRMFGWMLPKGSRKLGLSQMNMGGMGAKMIRDLMKKKGVTSLEDMIKQAGELGVRIHVCEMSMQLMGFDASELIDYPDLDICGVATFVDMAGESKQTFFL